MWLFFILLFLVLATVSSLLRRVLATKFEGRSRLINLVFYLIFLFPVGIGLSFFFPRNLNVGWLDLFLLFSGGLIWPLLGIVALQASKHVEAGVYTVISNLSPVFTLLVAIPFLGERLDILQSLGVGLLVFSGVFIASLQVRKGSLISSKGLILSFVAAAILGIATAYERFMLLRVGFGTYLVYGWGFQTLWAVLFAGKELKKLPLLFTKSCKVRKLLFSWGAVKVCTSVAFISSLKLGNATMLSASSDFVSVLVVIGAYFLLKEKKHLVYKLLAAAVGVVGLILLA